LYCFVTSAKLSMAASRPSARGRGGSRRPAVTEEEGRLRLLERDDLLLVSACFFCQATTRSLNFVASSLPPDTSCFPAFTAPIVSVNSFMFADELVEGRRVRLAEALGLLLEARDRGMASSSRIQR